MTVIAVWAVHMTVLTMAMIVVVITGIAWFLTADGKYDGGQHRDDET